jgi:preprotein translocase subunit SecA
MSVLSAIFDSTRRDLRRAQGLVEEVNKFGSAMQALADEQMRAKTDEFRDRLAHGETLDDVMAEAFALVREATWRILGNRQVRFRIYHEGRALPEEAILPVAGADAFEQKLKPQGLRYVRERYMAHFDVQMIGA